MVAIGLALYTVRDKVPSAGEIWPVLAGAEPGWLLVALAAEWVSMAMFARQQVALLKGVDVDVPMRSALAVTYGRSAIAISMPAGSAVSAAFAYQSFRRWGASSEAATAVMILSGVCSFAALALLYLTGFLTMVARAPQEMWQAHPAGVLSAAAAVAAAVGLRIWRRSPRRPDCAERVTPVADPRPARGRLHQQWRNLSDLLRRTVSVSATIARHHRRAALGFAAANWLADLVCLAAVSRAFDLPLTFVQLGTVYVVVQLVRQIPVSPGGMGVIEASLLTALTSAGAGQAPATAAVLGYRLFSCWLIIPIGLAIWAHLGRVNARQPQPAVPEPVML
ncbi:hypothetical protein Cs7R123_15760 [Catellatospora sp. TT07R-123]|uniref:lysylphosphatidylglycerol synthase transmembrane domain-containing protein n=1 Tax=Catellatospora sp. TT07R-123 TaxID=2733863 RepID=UPI001B1F0973|nr:lysylphosphatidylglycerol synthase transmembrane domain-containing protein [Catellatospora sp. TT07R-123]GHJ44234.1 hypothetical protein Cs7R123_15760 [Catellatospora sp. TT07R-123]